MNPKLVIILGPTAVGKSALALSLAEAVGGEIINADSQQVYRYMTIGTGKPSAEERARVPHHLIDVVNPDEDFNAAMFRRLATASANDIWQRGKKALVCGGTGLYLKAFTRGLFVGPGRDANLRAKLSEESRALGSSALYRRLESVDPQATSWIHPNDQQRIMRALEVYEVTGKPMSEWQREHAFAERPFETIKIGLDRERSELYELINRRCDRMMREGLIEEVRNLVKMGYDLALKPLQSVGYRHAGLFLRDEMGLDEALNLMKRDTRRLAKRQLTWFRQDNEIRWFHPDNDQKTIIHCVNEFLT